MAYSIALFVLAGLVVAASATAKGDDGSWYPGKYDPPGAVGPSDGYAGYAGAPGAYYGGYSGSPAAFAAATYAYPGTGYAAGPYDDDGSWHPGKYEPAEANYGYAGNKYY